MDNKFTKWLRTNYNKIINSIAFYPAIIAIGFLLLSIFMQEFDFSQTGKQIKANASWISLKDASTATKYSLRYCRRRHFPHGF